MTRKLASTLGGIMFIVTCTGAALAMPTAFTDDDTSVLSELEQGTPQELDNVVLQEGETTDVTVPTPTPTPTEDGGETDTEEGVENHGKAVSTAAHCAIKGRAHGELVRSVAQDKDATVESAQAACDAALAAAAAAPARVKPAKQPKAPKAPEAAKPATAAKPVKAPKPGKVTAPVVSETDETSEPTEGSASPGHGGPPPGKGNPHKP